MSPVFILAALLLTQNPPANAACAVLTTAEVSSLIGKATTLPVSATGTGASCMFQNGDTMISVLTTKPDTADAAQALWNSKKRIAGGADVTGWATPAYFGMLGNASIIGLVKGNSFVEVKLIPAPKAKADLEGASLKAVMKAVASRMASVGR